MHGFGTMMHFMMHFMTKPSIIIIDSETVSVSMYSKFNNSCSQLQHSMFPKSYSNCAIVITIAL